MPNTTQGRHWCRDDFRLACLLRGGCACVWCGATLEDGVVLTLDHVVPRSAGGTNGAENVCCCCHRCNSVRGNRSAEEFATAAALYINHGVTPEAILLGIREQLSRDLKPYRAEAKMIMARRPQWQDALNEAAASAAA